MRPALWFALALAAPAEVLTLDEAVRRAVDAHPDVAAARAARAVATFSIAAARVLPAPEFRVTTNNIAADPEMAELRNAVAWRWSPPRPRDWTLRTRIAEAKRAETEGAIRAVEARVAAETRAAYRRAAVAAERAALAARAVELRAEMLELVRRQVAAGLKERVEADLADLAREDADVARRRADSAAALERRRLARLTGGDPSALTLAAPGPVAAVDVPAVTAAAVAARAELKQNAGVCAAADGETALAASGRYPWVSFVQVTRRLGVEQIARGPWGFQVGVDLPVFRSAAAADRKVAQAQAARCRLETKAIEARVRREVEDAAAQLELAAAELTRLESLLDGPATRALESVRQALAAGRADRVDLLTAEARRLSIRERWLDRRLEAADLESRLDAAAGR